MTETTRQLHTKLWDIANELRGNMDANEFKNYILGFIFFKYLSTKMEIEGDKMLKADGLKFEELDGHPKEEEILEYVQDESLDTLGYFIHPADLYRKIVEKSNPGGKPAFILEDLEGVLNSIEQSTMGAESEEDFGNLFEALDFNSSNLGKTPDDRNDLIVKVMSHLNEIDFDVEDGESDLLGDAYEYLIGKFASGAGKKAGEFYTPQQVSTILAKLVTVRKTRLKSVYDPTCGSGSLLLRVAKEVEEVAGFYGQEKIPTTYNLCRMNMIMHDVHYRKFDIKNDDTLETPLHQDQQFEAIVANPPFSISWKANSLKESDDRFANPGRLAPKTKADFAFILHMLHHLKDKGTMAVVLPHGVLFRGAAEGHIRQYLIKECNWLDAVIGLPSNIFYGTSIPTCILVFKKQRQHKDNILFIDASQHFEKVKTQNELRPEDIERIISTYRNREAAEKYSYVASMDDIVENEYNLNIPRYVDTFEEEEPIDLHAVAADLKKIDAELEKTNAEIKKYCDELGIPTPF